MSFSKGFTLIEIIVVMIILGVTLALSVNYNTPTQLANAQSAKNNLLAIYSSQANYLNSKNGVYCLNTSTSPCDNLTDINTNLNLNIPLGSGGASDAGGYNYICCTDASGYICYATNGAVSCAAQSGNTTLQIKNAAVVLSGNTNPNCAGTFCPYFN